jgi:V/A-type H+-transporting ATPase subunit C
MKKVSVTSYVFAIGKIRVLEKFLIKQEVFEEAIEANLGEALRLFVESDLYSDELLHVKNSQELEGALNQELLKLRKLVEDLLLDKGLRGLLNFDNLETTLAISRKYKSEFLQDYFRHLADMHNIKTFLRLYVLQEPLEKLRSLLIWEGFVEKDTFLKLYEQDLAIFLSRMEYVHRHNQIIDYASILREPVNKLRKENSFVALEKAMHDFLIHVLKPAKYISFGPEPVLAYYFAKINEINLIRMIILSKFNNIPVDLVKERLNGVYA